MKCTCAASGFESSPFTTERRRKMKHCSLNLASPCLTPNSNKVEKHYTKGDRSTTTNAKGPIGCSQKPGLVVALSFCCRFLLLSFALRCLATTSASEDAEIPLNQPPSFSLSYLLSTLHQKRKKKKKKKRELEQEEEEQQNSTQNHIEDH